MQCTLPCLWLVWPKSIAKISYHLITHINCKNHHYLHVHSLSCEFQLLYILAILQKSCCDVTDNLWCHRCALRFQKNTSQTELLIVLARRLTRTMQPVNYNWFLSEPDHPSNQEVSPQSQTALRNVSNMHSTTRNCKISYSALTASECRSMKTAAMLFTQSKTHAFCSRFCLTAFGENLEDFFSKAAKQNPEQRAWVRGYFCPSKSVYIDFPWE